MFFDAINLDRPDSGLPIDGATLSLIELFSPRLPTRAAYERVVTDVDQAMWLADSTHRANNLAQLFTSLGRVATRIPGKTYSVDVERQAADLATAYADLAQSGEPTSTVPCARLLRRVLAGLILLFESSPGAIGLSFATDQLSLCHERRRALVLISSELVINALKYAFPTGEGGEISVSLVVAGNWVNLTIQDNGVGLSGTESPNRGVRLIDELSAKLGATIDRASPERGLRVRLSFRASPFSSDHGDRIQNTA